MNEPFSSLPAWLVWGGVLGAASSLFVAATFVVGTRLFPTDPPRGDRLDGNARRRAEIRRYLQAIGEPFAEDHLVAGQQVAFYLPNRDVAITFDARAYYRIEHTGTHGVLVEHELPGSHLGTRLPFETPNVSEVGWAVADDPVDPRAEAFAILGVAQNATADEVKVAYRRRVKEVHPDHGGDPEEFKRVREAYTTARTNVAE